MAYRHGIYASETPTEMRNTVSTEMVQVVIGTAPVHRLADPAAAVNNPILCRKNDYKNKIGYSDNFSKFTLCQSMLVNFEVFGVEPVVFINVLDPTKHKETVAAQEFTVTDGAVKIDDDVIVSSLDIKKGAEFNEAVTADKYTAEWIDESLILTFSEEISENKVKIGYDKVSPEKVNAQDIIGSLNTDTDTRTGAELIKSIFPKLGVVPFVFTAPGWSTDDTVGAVLEAKATAVNGCYKAFAISDIDTTKAKTREKAIEEKKSRIIGKNSAVTFPMVRKGDKIIAMSSYISAQIMALAAENGGVPCKSPSNKKIVIDDVVLADGTPVYYDQEDGNELNAEGIITVISRNGWYAWGNNTAAYPDSVDPVERFIMTRLSFFYVENDFINSYFSSVDEPLSKKTVENCVTDENIKLAGWANSGYIVSGKINFNAGDNPDDEILKGHFTFRTQLAANIPAEVIDNIFSFDTDALSKNILGGEQ